MPPEPRRKSAVKPQANKGKVAKKPTGKVGFDTTVRQMKDRADPSGVALSVIPGGKVAGSGAKIAAKGAKKATELLTNKFAREKIFEGAARKAGKEVLEGASSQGIKKGISLQPTKASRAAFQARQSADDVVPATQGVGSGIKKIQTAVDDAARVGSKAEPAASTAGMFKSNSKMDKRTLAWLKAIGVVAGLSAFSIGFIKDLIGTYPFSKFVGQEEAFQTVDFGFKAAFDTGNYTLAQEAIDKQNEIMDPAFWNTTTDKIPYANEIKGLKVFQETAELKGRINQQVLNDKLSQIENGETESEMHVRIRGEQISHAEQLADIETNAVQAQSDIIAAGQAQARIDVQNKSATEIATQEKISAVIAKGQKDSIARAKKAREDQAAFDLAYWEEVYKRQEERQPSQLNFGLI